MTTPERMLWTAGDPPSLLDEKKYLEERRRLLEESLQEQVGEIKERSQEIGRVVLLGTAAVAGVWLLSKTVGAVSRRVGRRKVHAGKAPVGLAVGPAPEPVPVLDPEAPARSYADQPQPRATSRAPRPAPQPVVVEPEGPSVLQIFLESEPGKMLMNQVVALLMVFVTKKLQDVLKLDGSADIGAVKESELNRYRPAAAPQDVTIIVDPADSAHASTRPSAA